MARSRPAWWIVLGAASFLGYFALLLYCDIYRPETPVERLEPGKVGLIVQGVVPGSPPARVGLATGDEIVAADDVPIRTRNEFIAVESNLSFDRPLVLQVLRNTRRLEIVLPLARRGWTHFTTREGIELLIVRGAQLVTLLLGLLVAFRRPHDPAARLGAWLFAAMGVFCVVFPFRIAAVWRSLPGPVGAGLWLPLASTHIIPVLLLSFFVTFPNRRLRSALLWTALWTPGVIAAALCLRFELATVYRPRVPLPADGATVLVVVGIGYLVASLVAAVVNYRTLEDRNERRRFRVLLVGGVGGGLSAAAIYIAFWRSAQLGLFASPAIGLAAFTLLALPLSFTYAILRHRLFDIRVIVRQGVRYAVARRLLLSLVPAMLAVLALDIYGHRSQPIAQVFLARASLYVGLAIAAVAAQLLHQKWLDALDRRFFRERYDAQRLLRDLAEGIRDSRTFENAAVRVAVRIDVALHPRWVSVLLAEGDSYRPVAAAPPGSGPDCLGAGSKAAALVGVLGKPLDLSTGGTRSLSDRLPAEEADQLRRCGLELLVPISAAGNRPDALLALGSRRSEEPYAEEDQDLLATIAANLALVLSQKRESAPAASSFRECPRCGTCYDTAVGMCTGDGAETAKVALPRLLADRYRLDRRLGRGGMGVVYQAADLALEREVAVKVLREDLPRGADATARFRLEARVSAGFAHPNVVTIYDFGIADGGRGFLVMERLTGTTLREELERLGALPPPRVLAITSAVCAAVDAAHRRGLVHRDLKPENVFLAHRDGVETPKILDFGIARFVADAPAALPRDTSLGTIVGTPQYMAPEQLRGEEPHVSWDIWALGVVTYEMLTGHHPFCMPASAISPHTVPRSYAVVLESVGAELGSRWQPFFTRALSIDAGRRAATAADFIRALEEIVVAS